METYARVRQNKLLYQSKHCLQPKGGGKLLVRIQHAWSSQAGDDKQELSVKVVFCQLVHVQVTLSINGKLSMIYVKYLVRCRRLGPDRYFVTVTSCKEVKIRITNINQYNLL